MVYYILFDERHSRHSHRRVKKKHSNIIIQHNVILSVK